MEWFSDGVLSMSVSSRPGAAATAVAMHKPQSWGSLAALFAPIQRWFEREALKHELNTLDPRVLQDLGINKGDFGAILAGTLKRPKR
jgi:uncharacterized protein YjiS (DUF1127 family)